MSDSADRLWWDMSDPLNAQPRLWPECAVCHTAYVYRWGLSLATGKVRFSWMRDCKHKGDAVMTNALPTGLS